MNDYSNPKPTFDWTEAQQNFMGALGAMGTAGGAQAFEAWRKGLEFWWQGQPASATGNGSDIFGHVMQQSTLFFGLSEQFCRMLAAVTGGARDDGSWQSQLDGQLAGLQARFQEMGGFAPWSPQDLVSALSPGLDTWQRTFSTLSLMPGDMYKAFHAGEGAGGLKAPPALGYTRETQERLQRGALLFAECQKRIAEYQAGAAQTGAKTVQALKQRLLDMADKGEKVTSLRQLYNLWIECAEKVWNEQVFTEEYAKTYGRMVNALVAFKKHMQGLGDEVLAALNVPTQEGLNTMQQRQQEMRRELNRSAKERDTQAEAILALQRELEELRSTLAATRKQPKRKEGSE